MTSESLKKRISSIDLLRGIIMVIMVLDHTRDFFFEGTFFRDPTDLKTTTPALFFTRWITHFCAPIFVFLAGTSAFLSGKRKESTKSQSLFLLTRGAWLILLEVTLVSFAWTFDVSHSTLFFQVIWAIGFSMICMAALIHLPMRAILGVGLILVFGHNLLDFVTPDLTAPGLTTTLWQLGHKGGAIGIGTGVTIVPLYPVIPWVGIMALGYVAGNLFLPEMAEKRKTILLRIGLVAIALFLVLRLPNIYGEPKLWESQGSFVFSFLSVLNVTKYPPSLLYTLMTLGPALIFLSLAEGLKGKVSSFFVMIGRVPLFFYLLHLYLIHGLAMIAVQVDGLSWQDMILNNVAWQSGKLAQYGFSLGTTYLIWLGIILILAIPCHYYNQYKTANKHKRWLSYL